MEGLKKRGFRLILLVRGRETCKAGSHANQRLGRNARERDSHLKTRDLMDRNAEFSNFPGADYNPREGSSRTLQEAERGGQRREDEEEIRRGVLPIGERGGERGRRNGEIRKRTQHAGKAEPQRIQPSGAYAPNLGRNREFAFNFAREFQGRQRSKSEEFDGEGSPPSSPGAFSGLVQDFEDIDEGEEEYENAELAKEELEEEEETVTEVEVSEKTVKFKISTESSTNNFPGRKSCPGTVWRSETSTVSPPPPRTFNNEPSVPLKISKSI